MLKAENLQNDFLASYNSEKYIARIHEKEYKVLDYSEEMVEADLIWKFIFT